MSKRIFKLTILTILCCTINMINSISSYSQVANDKEYRFGVADQLQIRVFDLRSATGEAYQWPAYSSEYNIDLSGKLSLPLIGSIDAAGLTSSELQKNISAQLQSKVGLAQQPSTTIQIVKYRPFYIVGAVQNPGEYEYRPNLTMIQSVGVGGGIEKSSTPDKFNFDKNAITLNGDLNQEKLQLLALVIKNARLTAEIGGLSDFTIDNKEAADIGDQQVLNLMEEEKNLLRTRRESNKAQLSNLNSTIDTLKEQIKSLDNKDITQQKQLDLSKQESTQLNDLLAKGLVSTTRKIGAEQVVAGIENNRLDISIAKLKSQQDLKNTQKEIIDLRDKQKIDAIRENAELKPKIIDLRTKINTTLMLIKQGEEGDDNYSYYKITYHVRRAINGVMQSMNLGDGDFVYPGDVIIVESSRKVQSKPVQPPRF